MPDRADPNHPYPRSVSESKPPPIIKGGGRAPCRGTRRDQQVEGGYDDSADVLPSRRRGASCPTPSSTRGWPIRREAGRNMVAGSPQLSTAAGIDWDRWEPAAINEVLSARCGDYVELGPGLLPERFRAVGAGMVGVTMWWTARRVGDRICAVGRWPTWWPYACDGQNWNDCPRHWEQGVRGDAYPSSSLIGPKALMALSFDRGTRAAVLGQAGAHRCHLRRRYRHLPTRRRFPARWGQRCLSGRTGSHRTSNRVGRPPARGHGVPHSTVCACYT